MKFYMNKVLVGLSLLLGCILTIGCSKSDNDSSLEINKYPLTALSVKVGDSYYHGRIDQDSRKVIIGAIENTNSISEVNYTLMSAAATISPDPNRFIHAWNKKQEVTVTTEDQVSTTYTIEFSKFEEEYRDILFFDDFNNTDGIPDPAKWALYPRGTTETSEDMSESYDQAYVKDGNLVLVAEKVDGKYKTGGILTRHIFDFTFGIVEVRARIPRHPDGNFPAIWLMPQKHDPAYPAANPFSGEIDIMEHVKQTPYIHQTIHTNYTYNLGIKNPASSVTYTCNYEEYNIYAVEWTADEIVFSVNGVVTLKYPNLKLPNESEVMQWPFTKDSSFYLILNMALGSDRPGAWAGPIDDMGLPAVMEIDWVKVSKPIISNNE